MRWRRTLGIEPRLLPPIRGLSEVMVGRSHVELLSYFGFRYLIASRVEMPTSRLTRFQKDAVLSDKMGRTDAQKNLEPKLASGSR